MTKNIYSKVIFVSKPRCASSSVFNYIYEWDDKKSGEKPLYHMPASKMMKRLGAEFWYTRPSFAIVREPKELLISWYLHHKNGLKPSRKVKDFYPNSFEEWIDIGNPTHWENKLASRLNLFSVRPLFQSKWVFKKNDLLVSKIIRLEDLRNTEYKGIKFSKVPISNLRVKNDLITSKRVNEIIERRFEKDYITFKY